eukprot:m.79150 g.79150  ORF g.79150 m.79150 type:complete len:55 (-) comp12559_c1_seq3:61-225(-)
MYASGAAGAMTGSLSGDRHSQGEGTTFLCAGTTFVCVKHTPFRAFVLAWLHLSL